MSNERRTIDEIQRTLATLTGAERIPGRDDTGDFKTLLSTILTYMQNNLSISSVPTGTILLLPIETMPSGFLECDGSSLLQATYADLYTALKNGGASCIYGEADATHFYIPDLRGRFVRGWDHAAGVDPDAATRTDRGDGTTGDFVGTKQADELRSHRHTFNFGLSGYGPVNNNGGSNAAYTGYFGGNETRPVNINLMAIIKY